MTGCGVILPSRGKPAAGRSAAPEGVAPRTRAGTWIIGGAATCLVLALVAAGLVIATTGNDKDAASGSGTRLESAPTTEVGAAPVAGRSTIDALVDSVQQSTVSLLMSGAKGHWRSAGLVVESGGMIVTAASAVLGARAIEAVEADGRRQPATVIAHDSSSGLAVVRTVDDLPAANFGGSRPASGVSAVAMSLDATSTSAKPGADVYWGTVAPDGPVTSSGLSTVAVMAPLSADDLGCPLIGSGGQVSGMLVAVQHSGSRVMSVFLPAQLVLDVAQQLVSTGQVSHGWLGVEVTDARTTAITTTTAATTVGSAGPSTVGVRVLAMLPGSPVAASGIVPGDVITGIDGDPVRSKADLMTALYADSPGTSVEIAYRDGTAGAHTTPVTLAAGSSDAPVLSSSP